MRLLLGTEASREIKKDGARERHASYGDPEVAETVRGIGGHLKVREWDGKNYEVDKDVLFGVDP